MEVNYNALKIVDLRALTREHGLRGYSKLRNDGLIAFLQDNVQPTSAQSVRPRPPKPTRPPPPLPGGSFDPYEWERAFGGGLIRVFESIEGVGWMWRPSLEKSEGFFFFSF